jgi:deferrochelatase/peroxidase EfeB
VTEGVSRRKVLGLAAGGAALGVVGLGTAAVVSRDEASAGTPMTAAVPFEGPHQAGITTPQQDRVHFVAFDVVTTDRAELAALLRR